MRMAVDQTREQRLSAAVVDLGAAILLEDRVRRTDRRDSVALDRERHVVLHAVHVHDGHVGEDDRGRAPRDLSAEAALLEDERGRARAGSGQQLTTAQTMETVGRHLIYTCDSLSSVGL